MGPQRSLSLLQSIHHSTGAKLKKETTCSMTLKNTKEKKLLLLLIPLTFCLSSMVTAFKVFVCLLLLFFVMLLTDCFNRLRKVFDCVFGVTLVVDWSCMFYVNEDLFCFRSFSL